LYALCLSLLHMCRMSAIAFFDEAYRWRRYEIFFFKLRFLHRPIFKYRQHTDNSTIQIYFLVWKRVTMWEQKLKMTEFKNTPKALRSSKKKN
jgi:hypothetical protein